jgi:hypothetical protein
MPLPWLKPKPQTGVIVSTRKSDGSQEEEQDSDEGLHACAEDLMRAIAAKDPAGIASALKAAFAICDSEPHEESNPSGESFESMNEKAAT